jgi:hypothetical protein
VWAESHRILHPHNRSVAHGADLAVLKLGHHGCMQRSEGWHVHHLSVDQRHARIGGIAFG